jgi:hypothetical protein
MPVSGCGERAAEKSLANPEIPTVVTSISNSSNKVAAMVTTHHDKIVTTRSHRQRLELHRNIQVPFINSSQHSAKWATSINECWEDT